MNVALGALIAVAVGVLLVGCTSECKQAAEKLCEKDYSEQDHDHCVAKIFLARCVGES